MPLEVIEQLCTTLLNRVSTPVTPFRWSINPYRGCSHACTYCFGRKYHEFLQINPGRDFSAKVMVKTNAVEVLHRELTHPRWRREVVAIGTAADAYQPIEARYRLTRRLLEVFLEQQTPVSLVTKNTLILRDLDLLVALTRGPGCTVYVSLTTTDASLARKIEPDTPPPLRRLQAMQILNEAGIRAGALLAPILPGLTDGRLHLEETVAAVVRHRAAFLHMAVLRLEGCVRGVYLDFIRREFPVLTWKYAQLYRGARVPRPYEARLEGQVAALCRQYGLTSDSAHCRSAENENDEETALRPEPNGRNRRAQLTLAL